MFIWLFYDFYFLVLGLIGWIFSFYLFYRVYNEGYYFWILLIMISYYVNFNFNCFLIVFVFLIFILEWWVILVLVSIIYYGMRVINVFIFWLVVEKVGCFKFGRIFLVFIFCYFNVGRYWNGWVFDCCKK